MRFISPIGRAVEEGARNGEGEGVEVVEGNGMGKVLEVVAFEMYWVGRENL